jgi:Domain of unknown function (DUF4129)
MATRASTDERTVVLAATLAGLAEAAVWALPVRGVAMEATGPAAGPMVSWPAFVVWFTLAVFVAAVLRHSRLLPAAGAAVGIAAGAWQAFAGSPDAVGVVIVQVLGIGVLLRAVMLATRDWREPSSSFGWGSAVLLVEAIMADRAGWMNVLPLVLPLFFLASLASRGVTTWAAPSGGTEGAPTTTSSRWTAAVALGLGIAAGGMAVAVALGTRGGVLQGMGRVAIPLGLLVLVVGGFALTEKGAPAALAERGVRWLAALPLIAVGVGVAWVISQRQHRRPFFRIFTGIPLHQHAQSSSTIERVFGLLLFVAIAYLLLRAFRARWAEPERRGRRSTSDAIQVRAAGPLERLVRPRRRRRELPEEVVRRWYAQTLDLLEEKHLARTPPRTPAEFAGDVVNAMPECAPGMRSLTRAYETVRYGLRPIGRDELRSLDADRRALLATIAAQEPLEAAEEPSQT